MQKFVPWSRVEMFCNESTWSTPLVPRFMFRCILLCLGAFGIVSLLHKTWWKIGWTGAVNAKVWGTKLPHNFSQRTHLVHPHWTLISCFCAFHCVWVHFGLYHYCAKLGAKRVKLVQKFVPRSRFRIFHNKPTRSTPLDPKLMFWCISYHLDAFGTAWLPYEPQWKTGQTSAKVRATKLRQNFSLRTHLKA